MPSISHQLDGYEFSPQSDRISLCAKMVYEPETDRIGYTVWDQQAHDWRSPYFRDPPAPGATRPFPTPPWPCAATTPSTRRMPSVISCTPASFSSTTAGTWSTTYRTVVGVAG